MLIIKVLIFSNAIYFTMMGYANAATPSGLQLAGTSSEPLISNLCAQQVQGKIPWDYNGSKRWALENINRLCRGAETSAEPASCFKTIMHSGVNWGGGTRWKWNDAINLCQSSSNATSTVSCFKHQIARGNASQKAIRACQSSSSQGSNKNSEPLISRSCAQQVQGKISWDYNGNKRWAQKNINRLCRGAETSAEPASCFKTIMHSGVNWGGGTRWKWNDAINLCQSSSNATSTVSCFKHQIARGNASQKAIRACQSSSSQGSNKNSEPLISRSCAQQVQGKIPWDYNGNKRWAQKNINRLCRGAETSAEPANCFKTIMHGGVNWGGGTRWKWNDAINLCQSSSNATSTVSCFKRQIARGNASQKAIQTCGR